MALFSKFRQGGESPALLKQRPKEGDRTVSMGKARETERRRHGDGVCESMGESDRQVLLISLVVLFIRPCMCVRMYVCAWVCGNVGTWVRGNVCVPYSLSLTGTNLDPRDQVLWTGEMPSWSKLPESMSSPCARWAHTASLVGSRMYIFGGSTDRPLNDIHYIDLSTSQWA
jgi:Kelch motif